MFIAKVTGSTVCTQKVDSMVGQKLLTVEPYRLDAQERDRLTTTGRTFVTVDMLVLITQGSSARMTPETNKMPIDTVVVGIVDQVHVESRCVYDRDGSEREGDE